jgi:hypothetical protein
VNGRQPIWNASRNSGREKPSKGSKGKPRPDRRRNQTLKENTPAHGLGIKALSTRPPTNPDVPKQTVQSRTEANEAANPASFLPHEGISPTGIEPIDVTSNYTKALRRFDFSRAAESDADDANLQELIDAWPKLPEAIRGAIRVMVRSAVPK